MTNFNSRAVSIALSNVTLNYVNLGEAYKPAYAEAKDAPQWSVQVIAEPETKAFQALLDLKEQGQMVKLEDGNLTLNLKEFVVNSRGMPKSINVFNKDLSDMDMDDRKKIGNGSRANVTAYAYLYDNEFGSGMTIRLQNVQVLEMVEHIPETQAERMARLFAEDM